MRYSRDVQVKQFVAVVQNGHGQKFMVFETGDAKFYLFACVANGMMTGLQFPVRKTDLRLDIAHGLRHGRGNANLVDVHP